MYSKEWSTNIYLLCPHSETGCLLQTSPLASALPELSVLADETHHGLVIGELNDVVSAVHCCTVVSQ